MAAALAAVAWLGVPNARAVVIRTDRDPQAYLDLARRPEFASVGELDVQVMARGPATAGSGTLVAPGWVVTAAHVLEAGRAAQFVIGGQTYPVARWVSHPKYDGELVRGYDIALVQLATPIEGVQAARLYRGRDEWGQVAMFVGSGLTGTGAGGELTDDRLVRAGTNVIDARGRTSRGQFSLLPRLRPQDRQFVVDFDNPANGADNRVGQPAPTELESLISRGDSGGAVFLSDAFGGPPLLAGVHSYGEFFDERDDSDYGDVTGHTRISPFAGWIDRIVGGSPPRRLRFVDPMQPFTIEPDTGSVPAAVGDSAARSYLPDTIVPEPGAAGVAAAVGLLALARRPRKRRT